MSDNAISLRVFAEVSDKCAAEALCRQTIGKFTQFGKIVRCDTPKPYWKIPEYYEIFVVLEPDVPVRHAFDRIMMELAPRWGEVHRHAEGSWAVWNAGPGSTFVISEVRWANLECFCIPVSSPDCAIE